MRKNLSATFKIVIFLVATTGAVAVASVAPNLLQTIPFIRKILKSKNKRHLTYRLNATLKTLLDSGYVKNKGKKFELTEKGEMVLMKINPKLIKRPKWDGKWRIVSFDVGENQRNKRDIFREELKSLGFIQMQRSVWVSPYPCEKYIELLRVEHNFGKNMQYILADKISGDEKLRKYFKL